MSKPVMHLLTEKGLSKSRVRISLWLAVLLLALPIPPLSRTDHVVSVLMAAGVGRFLGRKKAKNGS